VKKVMRVDEPLNCEKFKDCKEGTNPIQEEYDSIEKFPIRSKWFFNLYSNSNGSIGKFKMRLVAKVYS
jgi:hypothetical protein